MFQRTFTCVWHLSSTILPLYTCHAERKYLHVTETGLAFLFHSHFSIVFGLTFSALQLTLSTSCQPRFLKVSLLLSSFYGSTSNYENLHPFDCHVYRCLCDYMPNKISTCNIPCIFLGYNPFYQGFRCLDPITTKLYITRHAQFNETHIPSLDTTQAQSISNLHISNFLEPSALHPDLPPLCMCLIPCILLDLVLTRALFVLIL